MLIHNVNMCIHFALFAFFWQVHGFEGGLCIWLIFFVFSSLLFFFFLLFIISFLLLLFFFFFYYI